MLALRNSSSPSTWKAGARASVRRSDTATTSAVLRTVSSRTMNSSPPVRATVSSGRRQVSSRAPASRRSWSPTAGPRLSLTRAKRSMSTDRTAQDWRGGRAPPRGRAREPIAEERPVWQLGEVVVQELVLEVLLELLVLGRRAARERPYDSTEGPHDEGVESGYEQPGHPVRRLTVPRMGERSSGPALG